jgi:hypothetical protein
MSPTALGDRAPVASTAGRTEDELDFALDVVEALNRQGLMAVPVKPTQDMLLAGVAAGAGSAETALRIWQAMCGQK